MALTTTLRYSLARLLLGSKAAGLPLALPWQTASWLDLGFDRLTREGMKANAAVAACITTLAMAYQQPGAVVKAYADDAVVPPNHPLQRLLNRPNPEMSQSDLQAIVAVYKAIGGNAYLYIERNAQGVPVALWPFHIGQIMPVPSPTEWIAYYEYDPGGADKQRIEKQDIIHLRWPVPDPAQPWLALSPLRLMAREVDTDAEATRYMYALLKNDATPRTVLTIPGSLTDVQFERLRQQFSVRHGGDQRGGVGVVEGDASISRLSLNLQELAFDAVRKVPEARICAVFRVPGMIVGLTVADDQRTYSNMGEARQFLFEDTVVPLLSMDADRLTHQLGAAFGGDVYVEYDTSKVVALQENENDRYQRALDAWDKSLITRNEARTYLGLPPIESLRVPELGSGDVFKQMTATPPPVVDVTPPVPALADGNVQ